MRSNATDSCVKRSSIISSLFSTAMNSLWLIGPFAPPAGCIVGAGATGTADSLGCGVIELRACGSSVGWTEGLCTVVG